MIRCHPWSFPDSCLFCISFTSNSILHLWYFSLLRLWWSSLTFHLTQSRHTWKENLNEWVPRSDCSVRCPWWELSWLVVRALEKIITLRWHHFVGWAVDCRAKCKGACAEIYWQTTWVHPLLSALDLLPWFPNSYGL